MKSLKLITLGLIVLAQISLVTAMSEPKELQIDKIQQENLTTSIKRRNLQGMSEAVQKGANIDFQNKLGQTPLILAILDLSYSSSPELKSYRFIEFLIKSGANINQQDFQGNTPLMYAVDKDIKDSFGLLTLLVNNGASVNTQNELGETALIKASKIGDDDSISALIDLGKADVNTTDIDGKTAFDYYMQDSKVAVKALLMPESEKKRLEELELQKALQKISEIEEKERQEREDKKRLELLQERDRLLVQRSKEELQMQKEEEQLRTQRAQEVLAQMAAQSQEENWEEEQPGEAVEGSGEAEEGWENSEFQD